MPWPVLALLGGAVAAGGAVAVWVFGRKADRRRAARFADRSKLTIDQFWGQFFKESGVPISAVAAALGMIEGATGVAAGLLRPTDRFADQLAPEKGWEFDDGLAELRWTLESRQEGASEGIDTVDDFIRRLAMLESARSEAPAV